MLNMLMNEWLYDPAQIDKIRRWENLQLEHFGFTKDETGNWVENQLYKGDWLLGSQDGHTQTQVVMA